MTVKQHYPNNKVIFRKVICIRVLDMNIGSVRQKYCSDLTLSLQQHENILLKQLFHATEILCKLESFRCQTSQPYSSDGKQ